MPPCAADTDCTNGHECLANRCRWLGSDPVRPDTLRTLVEPRRMAVVGGPPTDGPNALPGTVTLGAAAGPRVLWLLEFELPTLGTVDTAFLLLEPTVDALQNPVDVWLHAWRVLDPWTPAELTERDRPPLAPPQGIGIARAHPPSTVRLDVTEHVRFWQANPRANHGLGLEGVRSSTGVVLDTGVHGGARPRLEIYATAP